MRRRVGLIRRMRVAGAAAAVAVAVLAASCAMPTRGPEPAAATAAAASKEALAHVERLRAVKPGADARLATQYNQQLEAAWKFFIANPKASLPVLREALGAELKKTARNDFILLDLGYYLYSRGEAGDKDLARNALFALDTRAEIVRWNQQELFEFTHAVSADRDARVLPLIDKAFLREKVAIKLLDGLALDETMVCAFLYGAYGDGAEAHLKRQLGDAKAARRILEVLIWIGTPASNPEVGAFLAPALRDNETFMRAATFLMNVGGPQGRFLLLRVKAVDLEPKSREYFTSIRGSVESTTFDELRKPFAKAAVPVKLTDEEVKKLLGAINSGYGQHARVPPDLILESGLPREFLIQELMRARTRILRRVARESIDDVRRTNALLNALYYREK